jgi:hypothetical protein
MFMTEFEKNAFGMTTEEVRRQYLDSMTMKFSGVEMVVAGILSDCQELLPEDGDMITTADMIRKQLNIAKFCLFEMEKEPV